MKLEKLTLPIMVAAAVIGIWLLFRGSNSTPTAVTLPNPSSSGVAPGVQPVNYYVPATSISPSPLVVMQQPTNPNPAAPAPASAPPYLVFNLSPLQNLASNPPEPVTTGEGNGGCKSSCNQCTKKSSCNQPYGYPDGATATPLVTTRARQVNQAGPTWIQKAQANINAYLALENQPAISNIAV